MTLKAPRATDAFGLGVLLLALAPGVCLGQTMNANSASYNAGYGRTAGSENQPVDVQMTDANGNMVVVGGVIQGAAQGSVFANASATFAAAGGAGSSATGVASSGSASAIGNNLSVVVQGDNNVVVVNSTQTNTGAVTATTTTNGK